MTKTFYSWMMRCIDDDTPAGDLARDMRRAGDFDRKINTWPMLKEYLEDYGACYNALITGKMCMRNYQAYKARLRKARESEE